MARRQIIEALDDILQDLTDCDNRFGGKVVVFGCDYRQIAPIVVGGKKEDTIDASFASSLFSRNVNKLSLRENMRAKDDPMFTESFMKIYFSPKNDYVDEINEILIDKFPGELKHFVSLDKTRDPSLQDALAIVVEKFEKKSINTKYGMSTIQEKGNDLTLWNEVISTKGASILATADKMPIIAATRLHVTDYNGISLSARGFANIIVNPSYSETQSLRTWKSDGTNLSTIGVDPNVATASMNTHILQSTKDSQDAANSSASLPKDK
ncbi:hypothetical protein Sango_0811700 [Sesamum angolense]|uniref:ATP-dependent DNA helicase n=1 Tax=Sesamum angolense TaxID=2727404 RepID=A0AAE1X3G9_9LAMI|nr:hypothetical protein Sango_0811700 [Sesamum angolense]